MQASELYLTRVTTVTRRRKHLPAYHQRVSWPHDTGGMATLGKGVKRWNLEPTDGDGAAGGAAYATTGTTTGAAVSGVAAGATAAKDKRFLRRWEGSATRAGPSRCTFSHNLLAAFSNTANLPFSSLFTQLHSLFTQLPSR
jgi:hypothetical protein